MTSKKYTPSEVARLILQSLKHEATAEETAALQEWLPSLKDKHIRLVHLSEIVAILNPGREFAALLPRPTEVKQIVPATQTAKVEK